MLSESTPSSQDAQHSEIPSANPEADENLRVCHLSDLQAGQCAHMQYAELQCDECEMLHALGMTDRCRLSVRKSGNPCIVQVGSTRIGLAQSVSSKIAVIPDDDGTGNGTQKKKQNGGSTTAAQPPHHQQQ